jgi:amino acid transporter
MQENEVSGTLDKKALSTLDLLIAGMSYMAPGFSLFFTTALIAGAVGIHMPLVYLFAGLGVLCTGAALSEFSRLAPSAGSLQVFLQRGFGQIASTAGGLVLLVGYICLQGGIAALFGGWTSHLIEMALGIQVSWILLAIIGVAICTWLMVRGVALSIKATWILFLVEFVLVLVIAIAVLMVGGKAGLSAAPFSLSSLTAMPLTAIAVGMVLATFSFVGFEGAISFAEETPDPGKAMPVAVIGGVLGIAALYLVATYAVAVGFGLDQMAAVAGDPEPIATLAGMYIGPMKPFLMIAIWTSIVANMMAAGNANARILFNMAREGSLPAGMGVVHPVNKTPFVAIIAFMVLTLVPTVGGWLAGWDYLATFGNSIGLGALLAVLIYMAATLALPAYVRKQGTAFDRRPINHMIIPAIGAGIWLIPLWGALQPGQPFPFNAYPWIALALIVVSFVVAASQKNGVRMGT